jgi:hypothetical protein
MLVDGSALLCGDVWTLKERVAACRHLELGALQPGTANCDHFPTFSQNCLCNSGHGSSSSSFLTVERNDDDVSKSEFIQENVLNNHAMSCGGNIMIV